MDALKAFRVTLEAELAALFADPGRPCGRREPIVLLSGWGGWNRGLLPLEHALRRKLRRPVIRLPIGWGFQCLDATARRSAAAIARIAREHDAARVDVIGYSLGGLVATHLLKCVDRGTLLRDVLTLGSPHRGSPLVLLAPALLGRVSPSLVQMLPGSEFLEALARRAVPSQCTLHSVAGAHDLLVPPRYAELPRRSGQHNMVLLGIDHLGLLLQERSHHLVAELLQARSASAPVRARRAIHSGALTA